MIKYSFFHGLALYSGHNSIQEKVSHLLLNDIEISCAEVPLGPIGVLVDGHITGVYPYDCKSTIDQNQKRVPSQDWIHFKPCFDMNDRQALLDWIQDLRLNKKAKTERSYCEIFMNVSKIEGIWYKSHISSKMKDIVKMLSQEYNVDSFCVERYTYNWTLGDHTTPYEEYDYCEY